LISIVGIMLITAGCTNTANPPAPNITGQQNQTLVNQSLNVSANQSGGTQAQNPTDASGQGQIIDVTNPGTDNQGTSGSGTTATTQQECSTVTPTCGDCVAKPGCGWCKSSNSCFLGGPSGPSVSSCNAGEWTTTQTGCLAPVGGNTCAQKTNCADCLSGSGCAWCIDGSKCANINGGGSCASGWKDKIYMCNYASR
jgi:hypothetical protein